MRRLFFLVFMVALPAFSQFRPPFGRPGLQPTGWIGVGASTPVNPLATLLDAGWNIAGGAGLTQGYAGVNVDAFLTSFGVNHTTLLREGARSGYERFWAVTVNPNIHVNPQGPADFYVTVGAGLYGQHNAFRTQASATGQNARFDLIRTETLYRFGVNGGAGFAVRLSPYNPMQFFIEARYHHMLTLDRGPSFIPVTIGVRF